MKNLLFIPLLFCLCLPALAQRFIRVADNIADMQASNPLQVHTNVFVVGPANSGIYSYFNGSTSHATLPYFATTYPGQTGIYVLITTPTGVGVTNQNAILSGNYSAGTNMVFVTNAFGNVTISSTASGGGGGDSLWTNTPPGTLQPLNAGDTNVFLPVGPLTIGSQVASWDTYGASSVIVGLHSAIVEDPEAVFNIAAVDDAAFADTFADIFFRGNGTTGDSFFTLTSSGIVSSTAFSVTQQPSSLVLRLFSNATPLLHFEPTLIGGSTNYAYFFGTSSVLTNGDSLLLAENSGSTRFRVDGNSGYTGAGTLFLSDDGTYKPGDGTANWTASGTTNSLLAGAASVYILNVTNYLTLGGTTNRLGDDGTRLTYNSSPLITFVYPVACSDETTAITAGTNKVVFRAPFAFTLTNVRASLTTAQASGSTFTVYFSESGTSVLSTPVTLDNTEKTSVTAATPPVISDSSVADDAELSISVSQVGDGTAAGLKFEFYGYR